MLARVDERTQHILVHQAAQNSMVIKHGDRIDSHDVKIAEVNKDVSGFRSRLKLYFAMSGLGTAGAASHEHIRSVISALFG